MKTNTPNRHTAQTYEGGPARETKGREELERIALTCMLWENQFYESGAKQAERLKNVIHECSASDVAAIAEKARLQYRLRHTPLFMVRELCRHEDATLVANTINNVIQRADELAEFVSLYWKDGKEPLSAQAKKGLAKAFQKFDAYQLAKYDRDGAVKLRDVLFLCHAKPVDEAQASVWKKLVEGELQPPDTWEVELSASKDKQASWLRLIREKRLGGLAILRNLRNMRQAGVPDELIREAILEGRYRRVFPFRFMAAAMTNPDFEPELEEVMLRSASELDRLPGKTLLVIDVSGSMFYGQLSGKSKMSRVDAACGVAILGREMCERVGIVAFSYEAYKIPPRRGFALSEAMRRFGGGGTRLGHAIQAAGEEWPDYDRMIVFTDEQAHDRVTVPPRISIQHSVAEGDGRKHYLVNVGSYKNTVDTAYQWTKINGFSEAIFDYIRLSEEVGR